MNKEWIILYGGVSSEREISLVSGKAVADALGRYRTVTAVDIREEALPDFLNPNHHLVFPVFHGSFGEDGKVQQLLEERGIDYVGSDSQSSRTCMDKEATKRLVSANICAPVADSLSFSSESAPSIEQIVLTTGLDVVLKPVDQGSSVGLQMLDGETAIQEALCRLTPGSWMLERRIHGHDITVGVLENTSLGIVEILPVGGVYDFKHKYTPGLTTYRYPAELPHALRESIRTAALNIFTTCGCRDFGRVDFMLTPQQEFVFLEVNTIPGLTPTSLLPKSASCMGLDFDQLILRMIAPAEARAQLKESVYEC